MNKNGDFATSGTATPTAHRKSGRAVFGADGRSSWEWQTSTGVFTRDITDEQLSALQAPQLQLVDPSEAITVRRPKAPPVTPKQVPGGPFRRLLRRVAGLLS